MKSCKEKALNKAEKYVHTLMIEEFKHLVNDTLQFPDKPVRPPMPENLSLDTIGVQKIFPTDKQKHKEKTTTNK